MSRRFRVRAAAAGAGRGCRPRGAGRAAAPVAEYPEGYTVQMGGTPVGYHPNDPEPDEENEMTQREYQVTGMTCGHCELSVREEVEQLAGVTDIAVSAAAGTLTISAPDDLDDAGVIAAVGEAGYSAVRA
ncbi:hypothetical protein GCM10025870_21720 [Agromyces marinus]|uniref:HMA domain-containing protein n=2 Tax=Agromyces marinus TaxID=1389020 RepID=A0ABN6YCL2_9MICO|nr:hypothetical protein GCM10025870_21720 [Agromyces marinus]